MTLEGSVWSFGVGRVIRCLEAAREWETAYSRSGDAIFPPQAASDVSHLNWGSYDRAVKEASLNTSTNTAP
jgi:hypothetical protein